MMMRRRRRKKMKGKWEEWEEWQRDRGGKEREGGREVEWTEISR